MEGMAGPAKVLNSTRNSKGLRQYTPREIKTGSGIFFNPPEIQGQFEDTH
jgi:hypothetical protein